MVRCRLSPISLYPTDGLWRQQNRRAGVDAASALGPRHKGLYSLPDPRMVKKGAADPAGSQCRVFLTG